MHTCDQSILQSPKFPLFNKMGVAPSLYHFFCLCCWTSISLRVLLCSAFWQRITGTFKRYGQCLPAASYFSDEQYTTKMFSAVLACCVIFAFISASAPWTVLLPEGCSFRRTVEINGAEQRPTKAERNPCIPSRWLLPRWLIRVVCPVDGALLFPRFCINRSAWRILLANHSSGLTPTMWVRRVL